MISTDAAIAANRFGYGARPGDLARLGAHARDSLLQQLAGAPPLLSNPSLSASRQLIAQAEELREQAAGEKSQDPRAAPPAAPDAAQATKIGKLLRDIYLPAYTADVMARGRAAIGGERDFLERLVQFWSNHFAVSVDKLVVLGLPGTLEREAIRPHVLGNFTDMLLAVEQHPAMLLYLDNQQSIGPNSPAAKQAGRRGRELGLNENLGREILELHTLGVDAGYKQQDVRALATMITGWSIGGGKGAQRGGEPGAFFFRPAFHEPGSRQLLGRRYAEDGLAQGVAALRDLAVDPHTARHVSTKLARHFVADDPPAPLVERLTRAWLDSRGDLPAVYRALVASPEAWSTPLAKYKAPTDYIYSAYRALSLPFGARPVDLKLFELLGQRSFQPGSPAGWPDRSPDWDGSSALLKRLQWAHEVGLRLGASRDAGRLADAALGPILTADTRTAIARAQDGAQALTLLLAAPEFMRR
ncbi:MAG TPA: DUF1800 domain-containing protein [Steroidobacteraceae bacterium]|nr:DUF1800 domain-containing protein [Steroidobacteraceae bacterium]